MKSFKFWLHEKRKNPELNPKVSTLAKIKQYVNRDDVYVSFRDIEKLGINPKSTYSTPNGIYCYWLKSYKNDIVDAKDSDTPNVIFPYKAKPTDTSHFYLFTAKENANVVKLGDITEDIAKKYILDYINLYPEIRMKFIDEEILSDIKYNEQKLKQVQDTLNKGEDYISNNIVAVLMKHQIREMDGYKVDSIIKALEDQQKYFEDELKRLKSQMPNFSDNDKFVNYIYDKGKEEAEVRNPGGIFWWFGWFLFQKNPNKWNKFFRDLGIDGMTDNEGKGIIHDNEPYQTVFFDGGKLKVIDGGFNKLYKKNYKFRGRTFYYEENKNGVMFLYNLNVEDENLISLKELPWVKEGKQYEVEEHFFCSYNNLTSLEGAPIKVGGNFYCGGNTKKFTEEDVRKVCEVKGGIRV
ncbi:MAG: hypothetical protein RBT49_04585 [Bacteroidales bacterium]|jgi:hypothetical protein|nr:hypothetical protein [Bacteroidales bacterium]